MDRLRWRVLVEWVWPKDAEVLQVPDPPGTDGPTKIARAKARANLFELEKALFDGE